MKLIFIFLFLNLSLSVAHSKDCSDKILQVGDSNSHSKYKPHPDFLDFPKNEKGLAVLGKTELVSCDGTLKRGSYVIDVYGNLSLAYNEVRKKVLTNCDSLSVDLKKICELANNIQKLVAKFETSDYPLSLKWALFNKLKDTKSCENKDLSPIKKSLMRISELFGSLKERAKGKKLESLTKKYSCTLSNPQIDSSGNKVYEIKYNDIGPPYIHIKVDNQGRIVDSKHHSNLAEKAVEDLRGIPLEGCGGLLREISVLPNHSSAVEKNLTGLYDNLKKFFQENPEIPDSKLEDLPTSVDGYTSMMYELDFYSKKPIHTSGMASCIAIAILNPSTKTAYMTHFPVDHIYRIDSGIEGLGAGKRGRLQATISGGQYVNESIRNYAVIVKQLQDRGVQIVGHKKPRSPSSIPEDTNFLIIDPKTGSFY